MAHGQQLVTGEHIRVGHFGVTDVTSGKASSFNERRWTEGTIVRFTPDTVWVKRGGSRMPSPLVLENAKIQRPTNTDRRWVGMAVGGVDNTYDDYRIYAGLKLDEPGKIFTTLITIQPTMPAS